MSRRSVLWMVVSILLVVPSLTWSQETSSELPPLTLLQAAKLTLERNPRLHAAPFSRAAAVAQIDQAALLPQWSVDLQVENVVGTGTLSGIGGGETTLRLSRIFQPSVMLSGRLSVASAQANQMDNELDVQRLDLMTLLARRFATVVHQQEVLQLANESVAVWQRAGQLVQARERAGAAPAVERLRTEIRVTNARLQVESAERGLRATRVSLATTWGDLTPNFGQADATLCNLAKLQPFEKVATKLGRNPDLLRFASAQRLHEARSQLANARRQPAWMLSAGIRNLELIDEQALVFGISVPLGSASRAAPAERRANALRQQSMQEEKALRLDVRATLYELYQALMHIRTQVHVFDTEILPRASAIEEEVAEGYRVGRFSHLELVNAQAELLAARTARVTACGNHQLQLISMERLTGGGSVWVADQVGGSS